jgi:hypothetical protein
MALCAITQSAGLYSIYGSHGSDSSSSSRREWENNDLLLFFYPPPSSVRDVNKLFNQFLNVKRKHRAIRAPFSIWLRHKRELMPRSLYIDLSGLWDPPLKGEINQICSRHTMGADSGSYSIARNGRWESRHQMTSRRRRRRRRWGRNNQVKLYG